MTVPPGWTPGYDDRGFPVGATAAPQLSEADAAANGMAFAALGAEANDAALLDSSFWARGALWLILLGLYIF
jgi:hypothetical protein